ncbi:septum formation inhibitor Maf [Rhodococcus sp. ACS1]|uniref:Nucleoside triphosphate pyrophosphatase n=1 Tax=Rhodococcus koreensis TaxID=99653 RepID=A0A1H4P3L7_9NOCA|nr:MULTISPECIES: Maf family protein [Rhodococcus]MDF3313239.1 Maf family protein [Rhodococcus sp. T2V]PBC52809.1 septum formation inhibitor Maf [Rhodococcus sp. ACS1]QSE83855.1 septum formation inhibitor Maf [Rhodococcus koreensis]SEC02013.1 septum formation protein [Rhodococcus koreensis]
MTSFVLASASPARLAVLRSAGVEPVVRVSGVDEDALIAALGADAAPEHVVTELARAKAKDVLPVLARDGISDAVIVGCDSMLLIDGALQGKPGTVDVARERWSSMAGRSATLLTGHSVLRITEGTVVGDAHDHSATVVHFASPPDADLEAYLATGEPLQVAGAFTLDSLGGWFVDRIEGDPSSVIGIGLPLVRRLLADVGVGVAELWATSGRGD